MPPITMTEPIRHGRLGGNGSVGSVESAMSGFWWHTGGHLDRLSMLLCLKSRGRSSEGETKKGSHFFAERLRIAAALVKGKVCKGVPLLPYLLRTSSRMG